ncbi:hypothetical protein FA13DRAFT_160927 [Coprinellus micaceus]|uniref:F-box domain-containing protein n=1 Tax=Coprinellus micaceus TaxID=71717 RepID=A0A4Y7TJ78_COPMI|nr:hypothetical protein FA13DRAFT_160927 [Coprinellus micaceus]
MWLTTHPRAVRGTSGCTVKYFAASDSLLPCTPGDEDHQENVFDILFARTKSSLGFSKDAFLWDRVPAMTNDEAPLLLTQICSPWRALAHDLPELWVSAHLLLAHFRPGTMDDATEETESAIQADEDKARLPLIKEWFERTGTQSLHLTVSDEIIFASFDSCITDYVLTLLDRVESLDLLVCRRTLPRFTEILPQCLFSFEATAYCRGRL